jgi:hypothetical protein
MDHALTDQHFDFGDKTDALDKADKQEDLSGFVGLLEGDAKKMEQLWSQKYLTAAERNTLGAQGDMAAFNAAPQFLRDSLLYPYTTGAAFVARLYQDGGGWRLVDAAYGNPPTSTAAVLHPERYAAGLPWTPPDLPAIDKLTGCALDRANTLGEFDMIELLDEHLSLNDAVNAANGWDGDAFQLVRCGTALGMVDRWQATDAAAAARLASALRRWAGGWDGGAAAGPDGRFAGSAGAGRVVVSGSRVDLVVADDAATADRVAGASGLAP